jgi:hypothetical protein
MRASVLWVAFALGCAEEPSGTDALAANDGPTPFANDNDADGYEPPFDCDDDDAQVYPGHGEFCNGVDDDCDGVVDEDAVDGDEGYVDADGDKAGDSARPLVSCTVPGWAPAGGDCDDADPARSPAFVETCNGIDDDCDGSVDGGGFVGGGHHPTIQAAIVAAADGDTIVVCSGSTQLEGSIVVDRDVTITTGEGDVPAVIDGSVVNASVFVVDGADLTLDGVTVRGGHGTKTQINLDFYNVLRAGGAINALADAGGHVTVRNSSFEDNAAMVGGAIAAYTLEVYDSTFTGNVADSGYYLNAAGGAVWMAPFGTLSVERSTFEGNIAAYGGAVETYSSSSVLIDVEAYDNSASVGGFLRAESYADPAVTVDLVRADIHDNTAVVGAGVALIHASGTADAGTLIRDNDADLCAGLHVVSTPELELVSWTGGTLQANAAGLDAPGHGGGLCVDADLGGSVQVSHVVILENEAYTGGGVYVWALGFDDSIDLSLHDLVITDNVAVYGAGLAAEGNDGRPASANVVLEDVEIAGNVASSHGGGLWVDEAWIALTNGVVRDNAASQGGGAYVPLAGALEAEGTGFVANMPDDVWLETYGVTYDADDVSASFSCLGNDMSCP